MFPPKGLTHGHTIAGIFQAVKGERKIPPKALPAHLPLDSPTHHGDFMGHLRASGRPPWPRPHMAGIKIWRWLYPLGGFVGGYTFSTFIGCGYG